MESPNNYPSVDILGIRIHRFTLPQALRKIIELVESSKNHYIVTPNSEMVMYAQKYPWFKDVINQSSLSLPDSGGVVWAAKYLSLKLPQVPVIKQISEFVWYLFTGAMAVFFPKFLNVIPERIAGADMVWEISKLASERGWGIFLLGAGPGVALKSARILQEMYPRLNVVEVMVGPPYESEEEVIRAVRQTQPQVIFLAFPASGQMKWMRDVLPKLDGTVAMGIGGALDFIAGTSAINAEATSDTPAKRAPLWMQTHSLEWLWRLLTQPWRRERVKTATIDFMSAVRKQKISE